MTPWGDDSMWSPDSGRNRPKYIDISDSITGETNQSFHIVGSPIVQNREDLRIETDPNRICRGTLERRNIELRSGYYGSKSTTFTGRPCLDWNKITSRPARPEIENLFQNLHNCLCKKILRNILHDSLNCAIFRKTFTQNLL